MKAIKQRILFFTAAIGLGLIFLTMFFFCYSSFPSGFFVPAFFLLFLFEVAMLCMLMRQYKHYTTAKLIIENQIMHIEAAQIKEASQIKEGIFENAPILGNIEVYISCFGILLDSKIIKFNIDGISLKEVGIGRKWICLVYGKDKKNESVRILHGGMEHLEVKELVERFRYETGIVPMTAEFSGDDC